MSICNCVSGNFPHPYMFDFICMIFTSNLFEIWMNSFEYMSHMQSMVRKFYCGAPPRDKTHLTISRTNIKNSIPRLAHHFNHFANAAINILVLVCWPEQRLWSLYQSPHCTVLCDYASKFGATHLLLQIWPVFGAVIKGDKKKIARLLKYIEWKTSAIAMKKKTNIILTDLKEICRRWQFIWREEEMCR